MNKQSTRYFSTKQEKQVAKAIGGKRTANSGATAFSKGDVKNSEWLVECKTKMSDCDSMSVKREWIEKNEEEAFAMGKEHSAVAISFGDNKNYYIINEREFKRLLEVTE